LLLLREIRILIKLINSVAEVVNQDPDVARRLKVVFFPDLKRQKAKFIYPAADLSEQIPPPVRKPPETGT